MGNVLELPTEEVSIIDQKDREYASLQCNSLFNDEFVSMVYPTLPNLDGYNDDEAKAKMQNKKPSNVSYEDSKLQRIMDVMAENKSSFDIFSLQKFQVRCHLT
jgi:hypothetical protein